MRASEDGLGSLLDEERIYVGVRGFRGSWVEVIDDGRRRVDVEDADWGRMNDGTLALAAGLLLDATGESAEAATVACFAAEVLVHQQAEGFAISAVEIRAWLVVHKVMGSGSR